MLELHHDEDLVFLSAEVMPLAIIDPASPPQPTHADSQSKACESRSREPAKAVPSTDEQGKDE